LAPALLHCLAVVASQRDYYEVLGIAPSATEDEIKRAYRKVAIEFHPDRNPDDASAEDKFKTASEAYGVLSDRVRRSRYDRMGHSAFSGGEGSSGLDPIDMGSFGEVLQDLIGDVFKGGRGRGRKARDLRYDLEVRFEEAALGCTKSIELDRPMLCGSCSGSGAAPGHAPPVCPACRGKGEVRYQRGLLPATRTCQACDGRGKKIEQPCVECHGEGTSNRKTPMEVTLPAGVQDGSVRSIKGGGEQTTRGSGDLHIHVRVAEHPLFTREGADLHCTVPVSYPQLVLCDQVDVPTLVCKLRKRLPPGSSF
jgi:molecular chaperone DnaJ